MATNITITFKALTDSKTDLTIELDKDRNGKKTAFTYGDEVFFRVYGKAEHTVKSTDGIIKSYGVFTEDRKELVEFLEKNTATLNKKIRILNSFKWFGNNLGAISKISDKEIKIEKVDYKNDLFGIAEVNYTTDYHLYSLTLTQKNEAEYPVLVIVY